MKRTLPPDFNPVYPYRAQRPRLMPPFFSTEGFEENPNATLALLTTPPIDFDHRGAISLRLGKGLHVNTEGDLEGDSISSSVHPPLRADETGIYLDTGNGLQVTNNSLSVSTGRGIVFTDSIAEADIKSPLTFRNNAITIAHGDGLQESNNKLTVKTSKGVTIADEGIALDVGAGLGFEGNKVVASLGNGLTFEDSDVIHANLGDGLEFRDGKTVLKVNKPFYIASENGGLGIRIGEVMTTEGGALGIRIGRGLTRNHGVIELNPGSGLTLTEDRIGVEIGDGLTLSNNTIVPTLGSGLHIHNGTMSVNIGQGLRFGNDGEVTAPLFEGSNGIMVNDGQITAKIGPGLHVINESIEPNLGDGLTIYDGSIRINVGPGLRSNQGVLEISHGPGMQINTNGQLQLLIGRGLTLDNGMLEALPIATASLSAMSPLTFDHDNIGLNINEGLATNSAGQLYVRIGGGLRFDSTADNAIAVRAGTGLRINKNGDLSIKANTKYGLTFGPEGIKANLGQGMGIDVDGGIISRPHTIYGTLTTTTDPTPNVTWSGYTSPGSKMYLTLTKMIGGMVIGTVALESDPQFGMYVNANDLPVNCYMLFDYDGELRTGSNLTGPFELQQPTSLTKDEFLPNVSLYPIQQDTSRPSTARSYITLPAYFGSSSGSMSMQIQLNTKRYGDHPPGPSIIISWGNFQFPPFTDRAPLSTTTVTFAYCTE